jgi:hypothetical protein
MDHPPFRIFILEARNIWGSSSVIEDCSPVTRFGVYFGIYGLIRRSSVSQQSPIKKENSQGDDVVPSVGTSELRKRQNSPFIHCEVLI